MDVIPSEIFRGHLDTIILLSLVNEDKHTNQIREEILERSDGKFDLKQGTFYSCLQRIVKQGFVTEYRATSSDDGVRRKFYQLTEKGKSYIDDNKDKWEISRSVVNVLLETPEKVKPKAEEKKKVNEKPEPVQEAFDIDKALKDFLNSDDSKPQQPISYDDVRNAPLRDEVSPSSHTEEISVSATDENVKIISFSDITAKTEAQEAQTARPPVVDDLPAATEKPKDNFISRQADSPELYDLFTLVGFDADGKAQDTAKKEEQKREPAEVKVPEVAQDSDKDVKKDVTLNVVTVPVKEPSVSNAQDFLKERNVSDFPSKEEAKTPTFTPDYIEDEDDFYNGETTVSHDYKSVLQKIFHQQNKKQPAEEPREMVYVQGTDIKSYFSDDDKPEKSQNTDEFDDVVKAENKYRQPVTQVHQAKKAEERTDNIRREQKHEPEVTVVRPDGYDFSDIQSLAKMEGFKVNVSSGIIKKKVNSILVNKLIAVSSWIFYAFVLFEVALLAYFTAGAAKLDNTPFIVFACIVGLFPLSALIAYFIDPKRKVASISTMKSVIELCIVIMLNLVLITIVFSILAEVDFSNTAQLLRYVLYPSIVILNVPVYFIIKYLNLENPRFFE